MNKTDPSVTIERVDISLLQLDPNNKRVHDERGLQALVYSLKRFGQQKPIVIDANNVVIAGNGFLLAARELQWTHIDCVRSVLGAEDAEQYAIADNRTAELSAWDNAALLDALRELEDKDADDLGFNSDDMLALVADSKKLEKNSSVDDPGEIEPPEKPVTRLGDLWVLGEHRLLCGDSTSADDVRRVLAGAKADLFATDPTYCVNYTGNSRPVRNGKRSGKDWTHVYRESDIKDLGEFLDKVFSACLPHVVDDTGIYVWHAHLQQPVIARAFEKHGLLLHQVLVWVKPRAVFGHSFFRWKHEPCAFGWRQGKKPKRGVAQLDTVWEADWDGKARHTTFHPTSKPTRLFEIPIELHTKPGAVVLEPFNGSGSQLIAAEKLGRRCRAIDIQPAFIDGTILRWEKATGKQAVLEGTSTTLEQLTKERAP